MPEGWAVRVIVVGTVNGPPDPGLPRVLPVRVSDWTVNVLDRSPDWSPTGSPCSRCGCRL